MQQSVPQRSRRRADVTFLLSAIQLQLLAAYEKAKAAKRSRERLGEDEPIRNHGRGHRQEQECLVPAVFNSQAGLARTWYKPARLSRRGGLYWGLQGVWFHTNGYRVAKKQLEAFGLCSFRGTNRGTIAKLLTKDIFDLGIEQEVSDRNEATTAA
jgi:hypothetical protein